MKHYLVVLFTIFLLAGCVQKNNKVQKVEQNRVETIVHSEVDTVAQEEVENVVHNDIKKIDENETDNMKRVDFSEIQGFFDDDLDYALKVFQKDCEKSYKFEELKNVCEKAKVSNDGKIFFTSNFQAYKLYDENAYDEGTITGYYEPLLHGSLKKTKKYKYPIYALPKDLIVSDAEVLKPYQNIGKMKGKKIVPYDTRKEIESGKNKNLKAIAYVDNKIDLFFLHIQGSGKIQLEDGTILNVGYAGQNGRKYSSIGKYLIDKRYMKQDGISLQALKKFFARNPSKVNEVLNVNERYIFFTFKKSGAVGALGSELTAQRNIAVDKKFIQLGLPVFLNTKNPVSKKPINQLMVAADVGGAIQGEIRADFFWGFGDDALSYAGRMKERGKMYILKPKY